MSLVVNARRAARADANQIDIVQMFRDLGALVFHTHTIGAGFPDIVVLVEGIPGLVEIKTEKGKLTPSEQAFHEQWKSPLLFIVRDHNDVLDVFCYLQSCARALDDLGLTHERKRDADI